MGALTPARRALPDASADALAHLNSVLNTFETTLGGREALVQSLALAASAPGIDRDQAEYIIGCLADPKYADKTLKTIARDAGITLQDLLTLYRHAAVQRAHLESLAHIAKGLPAVTQHVMTRAVPYEGTCGNCLGAGSKTADPTERVPNPTPILCVSCRGAGVVTYEPELEHTKLALSLGGLVKQGGGVSIVNLQVQGGGASAAPLSAGADYVALQQASDRALYGASEVIDADPIEPLEDPTP